MGIKDRPKYRLIIEAAVDVIAENGFHQAQVSKIAKRAGVADGTIYIYFKNKEDILISVFREKMGDFIEKIKAEIMTQEKPGEKLATLVRMHFTQLAAHRNLAIVTQLELRQSNQAIRHKINETLKDYIAVIDSVVDYGKEHHIFRENLDTRLARQMIFGTLDETVSNWVMNDQRFDLAALAEPVSDLLLNGLTR
ncbi:TetR/AcrR family fatty acid metabolism transcriptional regulator [Pullulanibacillus pueri]|uniref:Fatty acid metabolism regulator protein n=1 Tax=Pullulanibacillus pueri TaxID=1437324 RepID=A0A8J2ZWS0_9BACL|nr:TetR/AcrR family transcriptional regulator [Pullulanibacillus pueri]MBM7682005.1 TetR/AcrR family fatty acid metabolism transcriptional regulator [Pullulanibacillus pueri]GGH83727.1 fatty acid metabolism regulator protein [Pullulanibacillus pueri]